MAWNEFHEMLAETHAEICGRDKWQQSLDEWHSIPNDRAQRMKLLDAAKANLTGRALEETIWVVENTDALIANQRNIGVHMPLMSYTNGEGEHQMLPHTLWGNRRAVYRPGRLDVLAAHRLSTVEARHCVRRLAREWCPAD